MTPPIKIISTDFDGTLHADFEDPPVPQKLQTIIGALQKRGVKWVINTGRDLPSLMESLARARLSIRPDYLVLVEREIYHHEGAQYLPLAHWNDQCEADHAKLFELVRRDLPQLIAWVSAHYDATIYEDTYSPFCLLADNGPDADAISAYLEVYCRTIPNLALVRNDVYARFSHTGYDKGKGLMEISRMLNVSREYVFAAGDHLNDLPMLQSSCAGYLVAPSNAIDAVKQQVRAHQGLVSDQPWGHGVAQGLEFYLADYNQELATT